MRQTIIMTSTEQIRQEIDQYLDQVDESFLKVVHAMLTTYTEEQDDDDLIIGYDINGKPLHAEEAKEEFQKRVDAVKSGKYLTVEQLRKASESW